ncbi:unnamed protein product, partial [Protopolystoma xenopodis]
MTFVFVLPNTTACKHLWKSALEHHTFFRLADKPKPPTILQRLFRLRSRFYSTFRTEYQLHTGNTFGSHGFRRRNTSTGLSGKGSAAGFKPPTVSTVTDKPENVAVSGRTTNEPVAAATLSRSVSSFQRVPSKRYASRTGASMR